MKTISYLYKTVFLTKCLCILFFMVNSNYVTAQTITVGGSNWTVSIPAITEAGSNYAGTYESANNLITISGSLPGSFLTLLSGGAARVSVHYNPNSWNNSLHLYAKRSGGTATVNGVCILCSASINGGTTYTEIPQTVDTAFFTINFNGGLGLGNSITYSGINVQLQISGVSVTVPATSYSSQVVFTIGPN
jgi:hypothetical protein